MIVDGWLLLVIMGCWFMFRVVKSYYLKKIDGSIVRKKKFCRISCIKKNMPSLLVCDSKIILI